MNAYGRQFIATVDTTAADSPLHWTVRPFWHDLSVQVHADGISISARDDRSARPVPVSVGHADAVAPVAAARRAEPAVAA